MLKAQRCLDELHKDALFIINSMHELTSNNDLVLKYGFKNLEDFEKSKMTEGIQLFESNVIYRMRRNTYNSYLNVLIFNYFCDKINELANKLCENLGNIFKMDDRIISLKLLMKDLLQSQCKSKMGPIHEKMFYDSRSVTYVDGFIMEGKTKLLDSKGVFDSELDMLYRAFWKGSNGLHVGQVYFDIFIIVGTYLSTIQQLKLKNETIYIDSSFIRHGCFRRMPVLTRNSREDQEFKPSEFMSVFHKTQDEKLRSFYENFFLYNKGMEITFNYQRIAPIDYSIVPFPIPLKNREMENSFYRDSKTLVNRSKIFLNFMDELYNDFGKESNTFPFRRAPISFFNTIKKN